MANGNPVTLEQVLESALRREQSSYKFYDGLLQRHFREPFMSPLLEQLKNEEAKHIRLIEKMLVKVRPL